MEKRSVLNVYYPDGQLPYPEEILSLFCWYDQVKLAQSLELNYYIPNDKGGFYVIADWNPKLDLLSLVQIGHLNVTRGEASYTLDDIAWEVGASYTFIQKSVARLEEYKAIKRTRIRGKTHFSITVELNRKSVKCSFYSLSYLLSYKEALISG